MTSSLHPSRVVSSMHGNGGYGDVQGNNDVYGQAYGQNFGTQSHGSLGYGSQALTSSKTLAPGSFPQEALGQSYGAQGQGSVGYGTLAPGSFPQEALGQSYGAQGQGSVGYGSRALSPSTLAPGSIPQEAYGQKYASQSQGSLGYSTQAYGAQGYEVVQKPSKLPPKEQLAAEFIGTFLLVFTVGCNVLSSNKVWAGVSIASVLMVMIYAFGKISGGQFNPAVSVALGVTKTMGNQKGKAWNEVAIFCLVQIIAGIAAGFCYNELFGMAFNLSPIVGFNVSALICELLYTFVLCFVVLNVAAGASDNWYYGLAIGFVVIAGAYGAGAISGGCFNPAVAIGIDVIGGRNLGIGWSMLYTVVELIGGVVAAVLYHFTRANSTSMMSKLLSEFLGTFVLVLTVGLNVLGESPAAAFSIAASLMCMIYALGDISGAHFNPAVTLAIHFCDQVEKRPALKEVGLYMIAQILGGMVGGCTFAAIYHNQSSISLGPKPGFGWADVALAEGVFTFVLCFVVLCVAVSNATKIPHFFGLAIGSCITVGGFAIGGISGGALNPAVSIGIAASHALSHATTYRGWMRQFEFSIIYSLFEFFGAAIAAHLVSVTHASVSGVVSLRSKLFGEFIGTFVLVFTIGCNVLSRTPVWGGVSIASALMVMVYALGKISGANFNPAVTLTQGIIYSLGGRFSGKGMPWKDVAAYIGVQIVAGIVAGFSYHALFDKAFDLRAGQGFTTIDACLCELLYTFMLCFVVLNVTAKDNSFSGLAIGFVIVAGAYGAGVVSGGCFNPAVAIGIDVIGGRTLGIGWSMVWIPAELIGASAAAVLFHHMRPTAPSDNSQVNDMIAKFLSEFLGTFFLVLTVGLNVMAGSAAGAFSIAASLMCMVYALGDISGAHFNPAVTVAVFFCEGCQKAKMGLYSGYVFAQMVGGLFAAWMYMGIYDWKGFRLGPQPGFGWFEVAIAEIVFTFVLCLVVLCVAVKPPTMTGPGGYGTTPMFGLAIGSCITVGGLAIGKISGASLNPAVSLAIAVSHFFDAGWKHALAYIIFEIVGAAAAVGVVRFTHQPTSSYIKGTA